MTHSHTEQRIKIIHIHIHNIQQLNKPSENLNKMNLIEFRIFTCYRYQLYREKEKRLMELMHRNGIHYNIYLYIQLRYKCFLCHFWFLFISHRHVYIFVFNELKFYVGIENVIGLLSSYISTWKYVNTILYLQMGFLCCWKTNMNCIISWVDLWPNDNFFLTAENLLIIFWYFKVF